jgi:hypothetical protein
VKGASRVTRAKGGASHGVRASRRIIRLVRRPREAASATDEVRHFVALRGVHVAAIASIGQVFWEKWGGGEEELLCLFVCSRFSGRNGGEKEEFE